MIRASAYLLAAGAVWFVEGFLFSRFLAFSALQTVFAAVFYVAIYALSVRQLLAAMRRDIDSGDLARWRHLSVAPMLVVVLGSFVSLPILLLIVVIGRVL